MRITFSPQHRDTELELVVNGSKLVINGDILDFSDLPDGASYPVDAIDNALIDRSVSRINGEIHVTVILPYKLSNPPQSVVFPMPVTVTTNGRVPLPTDGIVEPDAAELEDENAAG